MNILTAIRIWTRALQRRSFDKPAFMPLSREEILEVMSDAQISINPLTDETYRLADGLYGRAGSVFGIDVFETPFAAEMRTKQIELPIAMVSESANVDEKEFKITTFREQVTQSIIVRTVRRICQDTTQIKVTLEWDSLAKFKRKLGITRWFPVRTRTVQIEGRVLYPYLKISLPQNRHHVQFFVK